MDKFFYFYNLKTVDMKKSYPIDYNHFLVYVKSGNIKSEQLWNSLIAAYSLSYWNLQCCNVQIYLNISFSMTFYLERLQVLNALLRVKGPYCWSILMRLSLAINEDRRCH